MKTTATSAAIKWTDEEWNQIADRLHGNKGDALLRSEDLEEIKARDVFEAQQVLPPERHRKLISIAQGFQGIRGRLHGMFQKMWADGISVDTPAAAPEVAAQRAVLQAPVQPSAQATELSAANNQSAAAPPAAANDSATRTAQAPSGAGARAAAYTAAAKQDFIEMARPFVAMVCEEFARALAKAVSEQPGMALLSGLKVETPRPAQRMREPNPRLQAPAPRVHMAAESFEEDSVHPAEVQPLFDPKLPPSANSDFKPTIGLVATRAHEYEDLQMLYPQLQLSIVQADAIRGPDAFRNCQRIIGLRDEVPPAVDDMLRRSLRHRYVRLNGGVARVREQLNAWLDKPGSINSTPRQQPRNNDKHQGMGSKKRHKWPPRADR